MFYVHHILAKKGPLATVWIAAHLQHRLKKSQYTTTDIVSAAERIINPEAPIALRLSSHLMLGVVRIYSKKMDYLYQDCIEIQNGLQKTLTFKNVDLSEAAANPPPESVTLPVFQLDDLDIDDCLSLEGDRYQKSRDEITLPDQVPIERNMYVVITFDEEDMLIDQPPPENSNSNGRVSGNSPLNFPPSADGVSDQDIVQQYHVGGGAVSHDPVQTDHAEITNVGLNGATTNSDVRPMEEDTNAGLQDPSSSNQRINEESSPQSYPSIEVRRDAVHDPHPGIFPIWTEVQTDPTKAQSPRAQAAAEKEMPSPLFDNIIRPRGQSSSDNNLTGSPSADPTEDPASLDSHIFIDRASPLEFAVRSTPPVPSTPLVVPTPPVEQPQGPQPRARRIKRFLFDEAIVLRNESMKDALADTRDISRKRKPRPASVLGEWKLRNRRKMEHIFDEPSVTAICPDLCNLFKKDFITANPHMLRSEDVSSEQPRTSRSSHSISNADITTEHATAVESSAPLPDPDMEIERLRSVQSTAPIYDMGVAVGIEPLRSAQTPAAVTEHDMDIEHLRSTNGDNGSTVLPEFTSAPNDGFTSAPNDGFTVSPIRSDNFTPFNVGSDYHGETTPGRTQLLPAATEMETPNTNRDERNGVESRGLQNNSRTEDLHFLEADSSPTSSRQSQKRDVLSTRTKAVEQYLKEHSTATQTTKNQTDDLSLHKILQGKTRKVCARMFYETLVLKSHGHIDVHQEEAYGDICLKLTRPTAQT